MQPEKWGKIEEIFNAAAVMPDEKARSQFILSQTENDAELRAEIFHLLENDLQESCLLDEPVFIFGTEILAKSEEEELSLPKDFAHYQLQKILGRGGMGTVFLAQDTRLNRKVALKVLPQSLTSHKDTIVRFRQEAYAASNVIHSSFAHIYDFGEWNNRFYLAMEYVRGNTLREAIKERLLDENLALAFALQIASALSAAHAQGIIHRDIKPENIIVTADNSIKILDFGLAKFTNQTAEFSQMESLETIPGMIFGTPAFMSPEQIRGHHLDQRTDIWSLGIVLYEMLTGYRPFIGDSPSDIQAAVLRDKPEPLSPNIKLYREFFALVEKCLEKDRLRRFQTASDFISEAQKIEAKLLKYNPPKYVIVRNWVLKMAVPLILVSGLIWGVTNFNNILTFTQTDQTIPRTIIKNENIRSVVVPTFQDTANDEQVDFLREGLAEDLTRSLGSLNRLRVVSYASARKIKETESLAEIKRKLNVDALLRGRIERDAQHITIKLELVDLNSEKVIWRNQFNAGADDLLKLRNSLTTVIANEFQNLTGSENQIVVTDYGTRNNEAYKKYLEGKYAPDRVTMEGTRRAIEPLKKAVEIDPGYALAYVDLADAYNLLGTWFNDDPVYYQPLARQTVEKALKLDNTLSEAHTTLAKIEMDYNRNFTATETEFRRAIELNPNNALAHHWYGEVFLSAMGRLDESLRELEIARQLNPLSGGVMTAAAWTHIGRHEYEKAIELCDQAIAISGEDTSAYSYKSMALMKLERFDEALAAIEKAYQIDESGLSERGVIYGVSGQTEKAREVLGRLKAERVSPYDLAVVYAAIGEKDEAFKLLEKQARMESVDLLSIRIDPLLDTLRDDPRFPKLEAMLNLP